MKQSPYAGLIFGASSVLFGVIALMWHDADTWQQLFILWSIPIGRVVAELLAAGLIVGGTALVFPRTARFPSILLCMVYGAFSAISVPGIIAAPAVYQQYGSFFEQFCLLCGGVAAYAATEANARLSARLAQIARFGLALSAVSFALDQAFYIRATAALVPTWIPPSQNFWAVVTTIAFALAAVAMFINFQARLAMRLMSFMLALFGVLVWIPRLVAHPQAHGVWSEFALTFLITGAAWLVASSASE